MGFLNASGRRYNEEDRLRCVKKGGMDVEEKEGGKKCTYILGAMLTNPKVLRNRASFSSFLPAPAIKRGTCDHDIASLA